MEGKLGVVTGGGRGVGWGRKWHKGVGQGGYYGVNGWNKQNI